MVKKKVESTDSSASSDAGARNGGWQAIEAMRERAELKASLADVWDDDFDLDEEILEDLDHKQEFFKPGKDDEDIPLDDDEVDDEYFDDEPLE